LKPFLPIAGFLTGLMFKSVQCEANNHLLPFCVVRSLSFMLLLIMLSSSNEDDGFTVYFLTYVDRVDPFHENLMLVIQDGDTPLLRAVRCRNYDLVQLLVEKGAKVSTCDRVCIRLFFIFIFY
jgi:ankyrin repeat protein